MGQEPPLPHPTLPLTTHHQPVPTMSTLVLLLWPVLGEMHVAITLVLRCSCRAWGWPVSGGQLEAGVIARLPVPIPAGQVLLLQCHLIPTTQPFTLLPCHTR